MPTPPLPEQPGRTPVPARDAAWQAYAKARDIDRFNAHWRVIIKGAFGAGWEARKINQYLGRD